MTGPISSVADLGLAGPVVVASGCAGTGRELAAYGTVSALGGVVSRSVTTQSRVVGSAVTSIVETPSGLVHATGLPNPGVEEFLAVELPILVGLGVPVVVSIAGTSARDLTHLARRVGAAAGVAAVEVNLSAPDAAALGLHHAREPFHAAGLLGSVVRALPRGLPVLAKLRTDLARIVESARTVMDAGAAGVVVGNALPAALPDGRAAGLSGPAILPLALRCVTEVRAELPGVPILGCGGVSTAADVRAFLSAGAVGVQVGTALLHDPTTAARLAAELGGTR